MNIEMKIKTILEQLDRLPQNDRITVLEYLEHREWGVALEHLCATICEENILISENVVHLIKDISQQMDIWGEINQIKDLFNHYSSNGCLSSESCNGSSFFLFC